MKTLEELRNEVMANAELKQAFAEALVYGKAAEFAQSQGVTATWEEIKAALHEATQQTEGELSDEEMANVAGGACDYCPPCMYCDSEDTWYDTSEFTTIFRCRSCGHWHRLSGVD